jgi:hypothetical protein
MLRRPFLTVLALFLVAAASQAQSGGERDLALGREALARKDYIAALEHLSRATGSLDPERDREILADAWLDLGLTYLNGLDRPEQALAAFLKSAEGAASPESAWLWASVAAEKLGRTEEAARFKTRAIRPTRAPEPEPAVKSIPVASVEPIHPAPKPEPAAEPEPPKEKPDAFRHFFGGKKKDERTAKPEEKKPAPEVEKKEGEKVDAFDYFFGKKRKEKKEEEEKPAEPPPTSPARSPARTD